MKRIAFGVKIEPSILKRFRQKAESECRQISSLTERLMMLYIQGKIKI